MQTWVIRRRGDGKFVTKDGMPNEYTTNIRNAKKFPSQEASEKYMCVENEYAFNVDLYAHFF